MNGLTMDNMNAVCIVDDSRVSRMMIRAVIERHFPRWQIHEVANAAEAIEKLEALGKDCRFAILDYNMPGMTGMELARMIRERRPDMKLALLTANVQKTIENQAKELGVLFVRKPVNEQRVVSIFEKWGFEDASMESTSEPG